MPRRPIEAIQADIDGAITALSATLAYLRTLKAERKSVLASQRLTARHEKQRKESGIVLKAIVAVGEKRRRLPPMSVSQKRRYKTLRNYGLNRKDALAEVMKFPLLDQLKEKTNGDEGRSFTESR